MVYKDKNKNAPHGDISQSADVHVNQFHIKTEKDTHIQKLRKEDRRKKEYKEKE